jgi:serine/threonine-protein kinase RsbW/stage II sporulation protein AB (anti-sigma F factor)
MSPPFAATYEAEPHSVSIVRNQMAALARDCGLDEQGVNDVRLAVSEAATNALLHAYRGDTSGPIRVSAIMKDSELLIAIRDEGSGCRPRTDTPGLGLGLPVIASVAKRLEVRDEDPGTEVRMAFPCPAASASRSSLN